MCGIAGIIYSNGGSDVGRDMTRMLQSMKHRGPDSTGYALFGPRSDLFVMRYKLADANDPRDHEFHDRIRRNRFVVEQRLRKSGADVRDIDEETDYAFRVTFEFDGDLKELTDLIEDVPGAEVLSLGHSLEIVKDLGDAETVSTQYDLDGFQGTHAIGHVRMATE
jgi:methylamine---glutamate N-methyltransferase subunit A